METAVCLKHRPSTVTGVQANAMATLLTGWTASLSTDSRSGAGSQSAALRLWIHGTKDRNGAKAAASGFLSSTIEWLVMAETAIPKSHQKSCHSATPHAHALSRRARS